MNQNIVLVTVDCLRFDRCGFNGYTRKTTPFLDKLARESYIFENAYATGPYTPESFPGILAGLHSFNVACYSDIIWKALPDRNATLASQLQDCGYKTIATISNPHLTKARNFDAGFEQYRNLRTETDNVDGDNNSHQEGKGRSLDSKLSNIVSTIRSRAESKNKPNPYMLGYVLYRYFQHCSDWPTVHGEQVITDCLNAINTQDGDQPVFAWTHLMDLHAPINPEAVQHGGFAKSDSPMRNIVWDSIRMADEYIPEYNDMYDSALSYVDHCVEILVNGLKRKGIWDNTVLIVTSDHGEALFDRGVYGHHWHYLFDELLHVPLLVRVPDSNRRRVTSQFSLAWMHELVADTIDIDHFALPARSGNDNHLDGESKNTVISDSVSRLGYTVAVRNEEYKFVKHKGETTSESPAVKRITDKFLKDGVVFDLIADQGEHAPLQLPRVDALKTIAGDVSISPSDIPRLDGELNAATKNRLSDLGYIE